MPKPRRHAVLQMTEVHLGTTPAPICRVLNDIAHWASWNRDNAEAPDTPQYLDQAVIAEVCSRAAAEINKRCNEHWKDK